MELTQHMRNLADWLDNAPSEILGREGTWEYASIAGYTDGEALTYSLSLSGDDAKDRLRAIVSKCKGTWNKQYNDYSFAYEYQGDGFKVRLTTSRENVCAKVKVGTKKVQRPDPDAPKIEVEEPVYEWECEK